MGNLTEKAAFLRSKRKRRWRAQLEVTSSKVSLRWRLKKVRLWQIKATVEYVVGQNEVSAKRATLERKDIQWTKPVLEWQRSHGLDHTRGKALYVIHQGDLSP